MYVRSRAHVIIINTQSVSRHINRLHNHHIYIHTELASSHVLVYVFGCMCACVWTLVYVRFAWRNNHIVNIMMRKSRRGTFGEKRVFILHEHAHTHTYTYIYPLIRTSGHFDDDPHKLVMPSA